MMKKILLSLCFIWLACHTGFAQLSRLVQPTLRPKFSMGIHGKGFFTDASLCMRWRSEKSGSYRQPFIGESVLIGAGIEHNYRFRNDFRLVPKVLIEYSNMNSLFLFRLQNRFYPAKDMDYRGLSWQVCPEIGFNLFHILSISYGYSFSLTSVQNVPSLGHQLCLSFNFILND